MIETGTKRKPWQLRVWHGMTAGAWFRLLASNHFAVSPSRWHRAAIISLASINNSGLAALQRLMFGRRIARTELRGDPIFILGHWRSGTTLLHELLALDDRHTYPSTYACLAPKHFLVSRKLLGPCLRILTPDRRSQDNVRVNFDSPQEDEWALCTAGAATPYHAAAFPNRIPHCAEHLSLQELTAKELDRWKREWLQFLRAISLDNSKRLVIKSPLHTARVDLIRELFPDARFVHLVRDPRDVYPSTLRLWRRLAEDEGLQIPRNANFEEFVLTNFCEMYGSFERCRADIPAAQLCEIRYEDLVADPTDTMRTIYDRLSLGGFEQVHPDIARYAAGMRSFRTNHYDLSTDDLARIQHHWAEYVERFGYTTGRAA
jgi:hypothetical protein